MLNPVDYPLLILVVSLPAFWLSAMLGARFRERRRDPKEEGRDFSTFVIGAALTLLALIIGFAFSMAVGRYDQRKNIEAQEAMAIKTEYVRASLLPPADCARVRALLKSYLDLRLACYESRDELQLRQLSAKIEEVQSDLWSAVATPATAQMGPVTGLILGGMNDVMSWQGYSRAAFLNRIPLGAWFLMVTISVFCNFLIGWGFSTFKHRRVSFLMLPLALSISLFFIADIDSPQHGLIRIAPRNLESLAQSLDSGPFKK